MHCGTDYLFVIVVVPVTYAFCGRFPLLMYCREQHSPTVFVVSASSGGIYIMDMTVTCLTPAAVYN